ncbi:hypothetical protein EJ07DRAFT_157719 [Lizonia empirigonia]|nr:hypothetical protein EJ07DRAFT_157719 [Lizonia empirigonia]
MSYSHPSENNGRVNNRPFGRTGRTPGNTTGNTPVPRPVLNEEDMQDAACGQRILFRMDEAINDWYAGQGPAPATPRPDTIAWFMNRRDKHPVLADAWLQMWQRFEQVAADRLLATPRLSGTSSAAQFHSTAPDQPQAGPSGTQPQRARHAQSQAESNGTQPQQRPAGPGAGQSNTPSASQPRPVQQSTPTPGPAPQSTRNSAQSSPPSSRSNLRQHSTSKRSLSNNVRRRASGESVELNEDLAPGVKAHDINALNTRGERFESDDEVEDQAGSEDEAESSELDVEGWLNEFLAELAGDNYGQHGPASPDEPTSIDSDNDDDIICLGS